MNFNRFSILLVGLSCLPATAATILFEQQIWHDPLHIASIKVTTTVLDNYNGDFAVNEWRYTIENVDFFDNYYPDCSIQPCPGMFFDLRTGFPHSFDDTASRFYGRDTDGWRWEHYDWALERLIDYPLEHMWVNYEGGVRAKSDGEWSWSDIWVGLAFGGVALAVSVVFSIARFTGDQLILPLATTISAIGLLEMQRLGPSLAVQGLATIPQRQLLYLLAGMGVMLVTALGLRRRLHLLQRYRYTLLAVSLLLLAITVVVGEETYGARLWISVGPVQFQPSGLVKITLVIFLASYLDERREMLAQPWRFHGIPFPPIPTLIPLGVMWGSCIVILVAANDLGASLLLFSIFLDHDLPGHQSTVLCDSGVIQLRGRDVHPLPELRSDRDSWPELARSLARSTRHRLPANPV